MPFDLRRVSLICNLGTYVDLYITVWTHVIATVRSCFSVLQQLCIVSKVDYCCSVPVTVRYLPRSARHCISVFVWSAVQRRWSTALHDKSLSVTAHFWLLDHGCGTACQKTSSLLQHWQFFRGQLKLVFSSRRSEHITLLLLIFTGCESHNCVLTVSCDTSRTVHSDPAVFTWQCHYNQYTDDDDDVLRCGLLVCHVITADRRCMFVWTAGLCCLLWECGEQCLGFIWADVSQHSVVIVEFCKCWILTTFGPFWSMIFLEFRIPGLQNSSEFRIPWLAALVTPLPSTRHHLSYDDRLEDNRENCLNCSVLCCVRQLCTMISKHMSSS